MRKLVSRNRRQTTVRLLLLILSPIVLGLLIFGAVQLFNKTSAPFTVTGLALSPSDTYAYNGSGILYIQDNKLWYKDFSDEKKDYSKALSAAEVGLMASPNLSALYNSTAVQLIGANEPLALSGEVQAVRCGSNHIAVLLRDSAGNLSISAFSSTGAQVDQLDFSSSFLVDFGFASKSSDAMWTITLDTTGEVPVNTITTYDLSKATTTGVMTVQGQLVEELCFTGSSIFAVGTKNILRYNSVGNSEVYRLLVYGWELSDFSSGGASPMFLFTPRDKANLGTVRLYCVQETEAAGEKVSTVRLPQGVHTAFLAGGNLIAVAPTEVYIYSSSGSLESTYPLENATSGAVKLSDTHILLLTEGSVSLMTLK